MPAGGVVPWVTTPAPGRPHWMLKLFRTNWVITPRFAVAPEHHSPQISVQVGGEHSLELIASN